LLALAAPASGEVGEAEAREDGEPEPEETRAPYRLSFPLAAFLRPAVGLAFHPGLAGAGGSPGFELDVTVGARYDLTRRRVRVELIPELGYSFTLLDGAEGHYGFVGGGVRVGTVWVGVATTTNLLLGSRGGGFDVGVRAGLRLEGPLGFLAVEAAYEHRAGGAEPLDGIRLMLLVDAAVVLMPMTLTRLGWHFGNVGRARRGHDRDD
jgi:hypothetical protein